jgi:hypothetical protein
MRLDLCINLSSGLLLMKQLRHSYYVVYLYNVFEGMHVSPITVTSVKEPPTPSVPRSPPHTVRISCIHLSKGLKLDQSKRQPRL